jgi:hypothetical protein
MASPESLEMKLVPSSLKRYDTKGFDESVAYFFRQQRRQHYRVCLFNSDAIPG